MTTNEPLSKLPATLIPGDGIGPEIVKSAVDILDALGSPFEWDVRQGGLAAIEESRDKALTGVFLEVGHEIAKKYEGRIQMDDRIVDATAMQLVMNPWQFDVIVTTNLFGDILSDQLAGLVGGLGMAPGANIGPDAAIFEAVHGSARDIAGKGIANPLALLLAVGLMLEHVDQPGLANRLRAAIDQVLRKDGVRTPDLGGKASTGDFTQSIIRRLS